MVTGDVPLSKKQCIKKTPPYTVTQMPYQCLFNSLSIIQASVAD